MMDGKYWLIIVRLCALIWFAFAALTIFAALFPLHPLAFIGGGATFGEGFLNTVRFLWVFAGAAFDVLIGWMVWRLDSNTRGSLSILLAIILAISVFSGSLFRGIMAAATLILLTRRPVEWLFMPGGRRLFGGRAVKVRKADKSWIEF